MTNCRTYLCILILVLTSNVHADSYYFAEIGIGFNSGNDWDDADTFGTTLNIGKRWELGEHWKNGYVEAQWAHTSQLLAGVPFNYNYESHLDHYGVRVGLKWR